MSKPLISPLNDQAATIASHRRRVMLACLLGLSLAGCSDASGEASSTSAAGFNVSLEETPCEIMPKPMVAEIFEIPSGEIEETSVLSSNCVYAWEGDGETLEVTLGVNIFETEEDAASSFHSTTRGMSAEEISDAMAAITDEAEQTGALDTDGKQDAANAIAGGIASGGLHFEDVDGVADEARFGTRFGTLYLLRGNMILDLSAYHGPGVNLAEADGSIMEAVQDWQKEIMPIRKQQSVALAKAIIEAL